MVNGTFESVICERFPQQNVLVLGDIMVDEYIIGSVNRISPEAPIPVLNFKERKLIAGGASNVACNLKALGCDVQIAGVVAEDEYGQWFRGHMQELGIKTEGLVVETLRPTTVKKRFATKRQQLLRVDTEATVSILTRTEDELLNYIQGQLKNLNAVILSDYQKGIFADTFFVQKIIKLCKEANVIIGIDSKTKNIEAFKGATFVKPNNLELEQAVGIKIIDDETLNLAGSQYLSRSGAETLIVTRSEKGISVFSQENTERKDFVSKAVQVFDVTGAGDTVISTITASIASGLSMDDAVILGNLAASVVIRKIGTSAITKEELVERLHEEKNIQ